MAVETCFWPLYEVENGDWKLNYMPKKKLPVTELLKMQWRFSHLFKDRNRDIADRLQEFVDHKWETLLKRTGDKVQKVLA